MNIAVSIHAGLAVVGEVGSSDPPAVMVVGAAVDVTNDLRKAAAANGKLFAISEPVTTAAGVDPAVGDKVILRSPGSGAPIAASLSASAPAVADPAPRTARRMRRLWSLWSG